MTLKTMTPAAGFAMTGVEGADLPVAAYRASGVAAVTLGGWRQVQAPISGNELSTATAMSTLTTMPIARNKANALPATHALPATNAVPATPVVKPAALPLVTTLHLVTTKGAGRGNKGSSPWRFPV